MANYSGMFCCRMFSFGMLKSHRSRIISDPKVERLYLSESMQVYKRSNRLQNISAKSH